MSLWWVKKGQLDKDQLQLIEQLPLHESFLVLGPPGSGKTNVLMRRAQFVRGQALPNILVLTFTRPLTEFMRTGCLDEQGRVIVPQNRVMTLESWIRNLYRDHKQPLPPYPGELIEWKKRLAAGAMKFRSQKLIPPYDSLFVDESQDLLAQEVELLAQWSPVLFFVADDRQKIYPETDGLDAARKVIPKEQERVLKSHYRLAPKICRMADRILLTPGGESLAATGHYDGPLPGEVAIQPKPLPKDKQLEKASQKLTEQIRVYADLIKQGDRLGVIVARKDDRDVVFEFLEKDPALNGKSKIIRAREEDEEDYNPSFDVDAPICILTVQGCKGLEFRAVHWLFCDELRGFHRREHYYTVVTRAKTSLDIYHTTVLPATLSGAHAEGGMTPW